MKMLPASLVALFRLFRRNGFRFFGKCVRHGFSREAWRWLLRGAPEKKTVSPSGSGSDAECVRRSVWFDERWYRGEHPGIDGSGIDPAEHYVRNGRSPLFNPGPDFVGDEYLAVNPDVGYARVHPLLHWERYGRREGRLISFLENDVPPRFPEGAVPFRETFAIRPPDKRRTAVFASFAGDGRVPETDLCYLRGLRDVCDNVVYVANNPLLPEEKDRLRGLVCAALCECHGEYDFGSYKRGWLLSKEAGLLDPSVCDEAVLANNSCYGPVFPFRKTFDAMAGRPCDFWGLSSCRVLGRDHIQSFFFVFRRKVLDGNELDALLRSVERQPSRGYIVMRYEFGLTRLLVDAGYSFDTLVPASFQEETGVVPSRMPVTTMERFGFPLLKAKVVRGDTRESVDRAFEIVRTANPELAKLLRRGTMEREHRRISLEEHRASFPEKAARIAARSAAGKKVRCLFLVPSPSTFPARPLFDAMRADAGFDARIAVVPDLREPDRDPRAARRACRAELERTIPPDRFLEAEPDEFGLYPDLPANADIVCYPSPRDLSCFRFNPHYSLGRDFLPICVGDGFRRSACDRDAASSRNDAYFWKTFFEREATTRESAVDHPRDADAALASIKESLGILS